MASATPSPTPNPDAMKYSLDTALPEMMNVGSAEAAAGNPFATRLFEAEGVKSVFGTADFVTVTRQPGADWGPITAAVQAAAEEYL